MNITLQSPQCFALFIFIFGFIGFLQGWKRAVVLMGFTLAAILLLSVGSGNNNLGYYLAAFIFQRLPQTINTLTAGALFSSSMPPPSAEQVLFSKLAVLVIAMLLGFIIGGRAFPSQSYKVGNITYMYSAHTSERFLGIIPGLITGYAIVNYLGSLFAANQTFSVGVTTPASTALSGTNILIVLVIISVVAIIIGLLTTRLGK
jgi:hypothetical protein